MWVGQVSDVMSLGERNSLEGKMDGMGTLLALCFMFVVGVSTGFLWKRAGAGVGAERLPEREPEREPEPMRAPRKVARASSVVGSLRQYRLKEIVDMTDRFKLQLGRGGQGVVYFAALPEGRGSAAVKRLQKKEANFVVPAENHSQEVVEKAFWAELNTISRLHHRNLVALLGYCVEDDDLFLVYEFMGKGSLSQHLHPKTPEDDSMVLTWTARLRCAVEVAQGLEYLHSHANPSLVHRDIKSGNILFDEEMNAKIADFGLSKAVAIDHEATVTTRVRGTHGYVDPVYLQNGVPCDKNDVYSYGVVLLELITGRKAIQQKVNLVQWCKDFLGPDEHVVRHLLPRMVDSRISLDISYEQLFEVVKVARSCVQERQESRPSMQDVVAWLHNANCKDSSPTGTEFPSAEVPLHRFGSNVGSSYDGSVVNHPPTLTQVFDCSPSYEIKENSVLVKCTIAGAKVVLRCKIWPTPRNFGLNKVEASLNGAFLWKKGLWWYNARSSREFTMGDDIKLIAEWHVALRTNWDALPANDPRRNQGPFCIEYLALKDEHNAALIEYRGDKSPLVVPSPERKPRRESSGSGSGSAERRRSNHPRRLRRSSSPG